MKNLLLFFMFFCISTAVKAQFSSSERVYYYQYVKTVNDGVTSKLSKPELYVVNFQNEMMGYVTESALWQVKKHISENPNYYAERARKSLADAYNKYKSRPIGQPTIGLARAMVCLYKYYSDYSTSHKYTYRRASAYSCGTGSIFDAGGYGNYWSKLSWDSYCYSFSTDREELIVWKTTDSDNRDYYKLVEPESFRPNTDFLD